MLVTVDLASKFSAVMVRDLGGEVREQWDSNGLSAFQFATKLGNTVKRWRPDLIVIEDVPYGISSQAMIKPVLRLQGILIAVLHEWLHVTVFLNPSTWQGKFPGVGRAPKGMKGKAADDYRIEQARAHAEAAGYTAPDLIGQYVTTLPEGTKVLKKHTDPLAKIMTDYVDAFLMSEWVRSFDSYDTVRSLTGVQVVFI